MSISAALAELMRSPQLPAHLKQLEKQYKEEQARRAQFFEAGAENEKTEFINGRLLVHPPPSSEENAVTARLAASLRAQVEPTAQGAVFTARYFVRTERNDYMPDVCYLNPEKATEFHAGRDVFPPPDLVVEVVSPDTADRDRGLKALDYALHGVREYWLVDPDSQMVEQYILTPTAEEYELLARVAGDGRVLCTVIDGWNPSVDSLFPEPGHESSQ